MHEAMRDTGRAVLFTTVALIGAFLSMLGNELSAIRDMGIEPKRGRTDYCRKIGSTPF